MLNDRFIKVDVRILACKELNSTEKLVLALIVNMKNRVFVKNEYFRSRLGISESAIQRTIKSLKDKAYIDTYYTNSNTTREIVVLYKTYRLFS